MKIALIQLNAGPDKEKNIGRALRFVLKAIQNKAQFILLPEIFHYRGPSSHVSSIAESIPGESTFPFMLLARAHKVYILAGSVYEKVKGKKKVFNTSVLIGLDGKVHIQYRKIHLFKASINGKIIDESKIQMPGKLRMSTKVGDFNAGLSICYDLRFPSLYSEYSKKGVNILCVPSCFTKITGQAHWEVLLRARAIENLSYVLAPNQVGKNYKGIYSYGNSLAVDPWGKILARGSDIKEEIIYADIDLQTVLKSRKFLPNVVCG